MNDRDGLLFCGVCEEFLAARRDRKWAKGTVRWFVADYLPGIVHAELEAVYRQAFKNWADVCGLKFEQVETAHASDYVIGSRNIDGTGGTLAESQLPYGNDAQIRAWLDTGDLWTLNSPPLVPQKISLLSVATHEFGHGIGIGHIRAAGSLMNPYYYPALFAPQAADIAEALSRYGPSVQDPGTVGEPDDVPTEITLKMDSGRVLGPYLIRSS